MRSASASRSWTSVRVWVASNCAVKLWFNSGSLRSSSFLKAVELSPASKRRRPDSECEISDWAVVLRMYSTADSVSTGRKCAKQKRSWNWFDTIETGTMPRSCCLNDGNQSSARSREECDSAVGLERNYSALQCPYFLGKSTLPPLQRLSTISLMPVARS